MSYSLGKFYGSTEQFFGLVRAIESRPLIRHTDVSRHSFCPMTRRCRFCGVDESVSAANGSYCRPVSDCSES